MHFFKKKKKIKKRESFINNFLKISNILEKFTP